MNATTDYYKENGKIVSRVIFDDTFERFTRIFAQSLGFSYQLLPPKDGEIGRRLPDGNWTGVIGMLQRNEADLAITSLFMSLQRSEVVDFSYPYEVTKFSFATRKPEYHPKITAVLSPFSLNVWLIIAAFLILMPFLLSVFYGNFNPMKVLFWSTFSSLLTQNIRLQPKKATDYFILGSWLTGTTFLIYSYMTVFLAFLTFPPLNAVRTVPELATAVAKGEYKCVTYHGTLISIALSKSSDPNSRIIGRSLLETKGSNNIDIILGDKKSFKKMAYIGVEAHLLIWKENFFYSGDLIFPMLSAVAMRKNFCCKAHIDGVIRRIWEAGIFRKLIEQRIYQNTVQIFNLNPMMISETKERPITLEHLKGAFVFLAMGYFLSLLVFMFEVYGEKQNLIHF